MTDVVVTIAGRALSERGKGSNAKLIFYDLHADGAKVQVMAQLQNHAAGPDDFAPCHKLIKRGDIIGVKGFVGKLEM